MTHHTQVPGVARLIALDWGSTALRAWLLGDDGRVLDTHARDSGLLNVTSGNSDTRAGDYEKVFTDVCADWLDAHPGVPAIACGMVGSAQGWHEAGYLTVPTDLEFDAATLTRVPHQRGTLHLVPGLRVAPGAHTAGDVMRGEETQLVGVLDLLDDPAGDLLVVLPGTHTKWVRIVAGQVYTFTTAMTGELYGLLMEHGILARTAHAPARDDAAFVRGLDADTSRGISTALFGARALVLDGALAPGALPDYVSGLLIADEIRHLLQTAPGQRIVLCGKPDLCRRYATALGRHGVQPSASLTEEAAARGLWHVAATSGLVDARSRTEEVS
ncbi:2-dehydro-3-deoxygalactonokinase [Mycolicibacterium goodii]|uniref:2-dehydro-3-deoxygalactonokinase n=1 Tax=Mycolicibacterium goodii TaxID=134601 RepID=UPI0027DECD4A|nr:2-dehydro-3-deoxygalactonokinase [Mycolicibacterium goodii]